MQNNTREITPASVGLGILLGAVLTAANAYLGLYAGMTVSASIPASVLSMAILRGVLRRGSILENNIVQTIAASGESLAAGVIFTVPALLMVGVWDTVPFWTTTLICFSGGMLGILFMIPLRRAHVIEDKSLTYPEGVACAEVLRAGGSTLSTVWPVGLGLVVGAAVKGATVGIQILKSSVEGAVLWGRSAFYCGTEISAALVAVGFIVGPTVALLAFGGGLLTWGVALPLWGVQSGVSADPVSWFWEAWSQHGRYLGVGAMWVGGLASLWEVRHSVQKALGQTWAQFQATETATETPRTEKNLSPTEQLGLFAATALLLLGLCYSVVDSFLLSLVITGFVLVLAFFLCAISSYLVGLLGTSNSPVSGVTLTAIAVTGLFFLAIGYSSPLALAPLLVMGGVICCAACSAGDISQDLKTGYLIGATPRAQQWMEVVGAAVAAVVMAPVLGVLHHAYGLGTGQPGALKAPQAMLVASLARGIFSHGDLPWHAIGLGAGIGCALLLAEQGLKVRKSTLRLPVMAVAVGMYLPLTVTAPVALGGLVAFLTRGGKGQERGTLWASGLIAGEALAGVFLAAVIYTRGKILPLPGMNSGGWAVAVLFGLAASFGWMARGQTPKT